MELGCDICFDWPSSLWKCLPTFFFACANFSFFALQALLPLRRCPFFLNAFFGSHAPVSFLLLSPFLQNGGGGGGWRWAVSGCPCVASRGFSSPPARLGPAGGVGEPLVACSVHTSSLLSPRFIHGLGIQELLSCGGLLLPVLSVGSPSSSLHARRGDGAGESSGVFSVLGCLSRLIFVRSARW